MAPLILLDGRRSGIDRLGVVGGLAVSCRRNGGGALLHDDGLLAAAAAPYPDADRDENAAWQQPREKDERKQTQGGASDGTRVPTEPDVVAPAAALRAAAVAPGAVVVDGAPGAVYLCAAGEALAGALRKLRSPTVPRRAGAAPAVDAGAKSLVVAPLAVPESSWDAGIAARILTAGSRDSDKRRKSQEPEQHQTAQPPPKESQQKHKR